MKPKFLLPLLALLFPLLSFAQSANLTIFSEDGDKFYLILNGQAQNTMPQTNLRVEGLAQPYYNAKIVFEDKNKKPLMKNIPVFDPANNTPSDVTYKIKRAKDGELKIRYFSAVPVQPNYTPPADVYVMHFGQPAPATTVTQTTVTTTGVNGTNASVNAGGVNMNVTITDPNMHVTQTTTTTTSTSSSGATGTYSTGCQYPMEWSSFNEAKKTIEAASFEDTKFSTAKSIVDANCLSSDEVLLVCKVFSFEKTKLDFAKYAYLKTVDPGNYFKVNNAFDFDASKTELSNFTSSHH